MRWWLLQMASNCHRSASVYFKGKHAKKASDGWMGIYITNSLPDAGEDKYIERWKMAAANTSVYNLIQSSSQWMKQPRKRWNETFPIKVQNTNAFIRYWAVVYKWICYANPMFRLLVLRGWTKYWQMILSGKNCYQKSANRKCFWYEKVQSGLS